MEQTPNRRKPAPKPNNALGSLLGSVVLGVCIIIAGSTVAGSVKKLTAAVEAQTWLASMRMQMSLPTASRTAARRATSSSGSMPTLTFRQS